MDENKKISATEFFNLLKQYWKSNPQKSYKEIILTLIDTELVSDYGMSHKIEEFILSEDKAYEKLKKLCTQDVDIDDFLANKIIKL